MEVVTKNNTYFYDNKTGLIFADNSIISSILNISEWDSLSELELINILKINFDENKIIFYLKWLKKYILFCKKYNYINNMSSSICEIEDYLLKFGFKQLIFSITEDCNFRCSYCIYSDEFLESRNHSLKYMDFDTAKKAINIYFKYFTEGKCYNLFKNPSFSFYGGEPLLNFNLIKKIVSYIKSIYSGEIYFSITTNGSLLTKEISDYLMDNNFSILVSLDGDETEHNRKRKYKNGHNTFNDVFNNLKYILDKNYDNIAINSVFDWDTNFINCENFFWNNNLKITNVSAVDDSFTKQYYNKFSISDFNYHKCYLEYLEQNYQFFNKNEDSYLYHLIEYPLISTLLDSNFISVQRNFNNYTGPVFLGKSYF
ncbi:MAG: radical SAM protein [archaeon]|nr:radical SAM protein [archaeon]